MSEFNMPQVVKALSMLDEQQRALDKNRKFLHSTLSELGNIETPPLSDSDIVPQSSERIKVIKALQRLVIVFVEASEEDIVDLEPEDAASTKDMYIGDAMDYHTIIALIIEGKDGEAVNMQNGLDTAPRGAIDTPDGDGFVLREFFR